MNDIPAEGETTATPKITIHGKVKFYDPDKGFGFVVPHESQPITADIMFNHATLRAIGLEDIVRGQEVMARVEPNPNDKSRYRASFITREGEILAPAPKGGPKAELKPEKYADCPQITEDFIATVKWFSARKGYGFVRAVPGEPSPAGEGDIFLPAKDAKRDGYFLEDLKPGTRITVTAVYKTPNGFAVARLAPAPR